MSYIPGEKVTIERFDDYWKMGEHGKSLPYLDGMEIRTITDTTALFAALKAGQVDVYWQLPQKFAHTIKDDPKVRPVPTAFSTQHFYFVYEHQRTTGDNVFGDIRARRALLLALDKNELAAVGFGESGISLPTNQMIPPTLPFGPTNFPDIKQDKDEARKLFAELGITELHLVLLDIFGWSTPVGAAFKRQMNDVGVDVTIYQERVADWLCAMGQGDCGPDWKWPNMVSINGAANPPEPSLHINQRWICPGVNTMGKWCDSDMDNLATATTQTTENAERARLYTEWNQIFVDKIPAVNWVQVQDWHGESKAVNGIEDLYLVLWYEHVWLDR